MSSFESRSVNATRTTIGRTKMRPVKVACPRCDVTWRGSTEDECWSCGRHLAIAAPVATVKIAPPAAAAS